MEAWCRMSFSYYSSYSYRFAMKIYCYWLQGDLSETSDRILWANHHGLVFLCITVAAAY
jgi:hypothetical protein